MKSAIFAGIAAFGAVIGILNGGNSYIIATNIGICLVLSLKAFQERD